MKKHIITTIIIIALPFIFMLIEKSNNELLSNFGMFAQMLYLTPALVASEILFEFEHDIGLVPTDLTRITVIIFYLVVYWSCVMLFRLRKWREVQSS